MHTFQLILKKDNIVGFELYGMKYLHRTDAMGATEKYKHGEVLEYIAVSKKVLSDMQAQLEFRHMAAFMLTVEFIAIEAMKEYFSETAVAEVNYLGSPKILSTQRGSMLIITQFGELLGVILKHPSDIFVVKSVMGQYTQRTTWAEVGTLMYAILADKFGYHEEMILPKGDKQIAMFREVKYGEGCHRLDPCFLPEKLGVTVWEISK